MTKWIFMHLKVNLCICQKFSIHKQFSNKNQLIHSLCFSLSLFYLYQNQKQNIHLFSIFFLMLFFGRFGSVIHFSAHYTVSLPTQTNQFLIVSYKSGFCKSFLFPQTIFSSIFQFYFFFPQNSKLFSFHTFTHIHVRQNKTWTYKSIMLFFKFSIQNVWLENWSSKVQKTYK